MIGERPVSSGLILRVWHDRRPNPAALFPSSVVRQGWRSPIQQAQKSSRRQLPFTRFPKIFSSCLQSLTKETHRPAANPCITLESERLLLTRVAAMPVFRPERIVRMVLSASWGLRFGGGNRTCRSESKERGAGQEGIDSLSRDLPVFPVGPFG